MKLYLKRGFTLLLSLIMCFQLVACGGKETKKTEKGPDEFVYVPDFITLDNNVNLDGATMLEDTLYYLKTEQVENQNQNILCSYNINDKKTETYVIEYKKNSYINTIMPGIDNTFWIIQSVYGMEEENVVNEEETVETQEGINENAIFLTQINLKGELIQEVNITEIIEKEEQAYISIAIIDNEGNIYITNGDSIIWVFDPNGTLLFTIPLDNWINTIGVSKEGTVIISQYGSEGKTWKSIDFEKKAFDKTYSDIPSTNGKEIIKAGSDNSVLFTANNGLATYDFNEQKTEMLFTFIDCNISSNDIRDFFMLKDGRIVVATAEYSSESTSNELVILTKVPASKVNAKKELTYATFWLDSVIQKDIVNFNKSNTTYQIKVKEYMSDDIEYEDAMAKFNADLTSGNVPDIINTQSGFNFETIALKGIFEDLHPYFEKDEDINLNDYFDNVLKAYEVDGKLYGIMGRFNIQTLLGKTSDIGNRTKWTMEEFIEFANEFPDDVEVIDFGTKSNVLSLCISNNINTFINYSTGECSFNTKEFEQVLEFANRYPAEWNYDEDSLSTPLKLQSGQLILNSPYIGDINEMLVNQLMFEEDTTFIGYPSSDGSGITVAPSIAMAISSKSANKEGAWEFLKTIISDEAQNKEHSWGFPIQKKAFDALMQKAMTPNTYINENGEEVVSERTWGFDGWECKVPTATQKDVDLLKEIISKISSVPSYDEEMLKIITEEAESYFKGAKSAADVAQIIQSRIQIYVSEKK